MGSTSRYAVPMATLDSVRVPVEQQVEEQDVDSDAECLAREELERARLLALSQRG